MTDNPCQGLTKAQTGAFLAIAVNYFPNCTNATLQRLLDRGLIVRRKKPASCKYDYFVPRRIFSQWFKWANERFE